MITQKVYEIYNLLRESVKNLEVQYLDDDTLNTQQAASVLETAT